MKFLFLKWLGYLFLSLIYKTCKIQIDGEENFTEVYNNNKPIMLCVWHGRMLFPIFYVIKKKLTPWAIASPYEDGAIVASILKKWNVKIIKGSSNRAPKEVINKIESIFKKDSNEMICITNDGPKGPRHVAKKGSIELAQKLDAQIITITGIASRTWIFNSWDQFYLPKPFSKIIIHVAPAYNKCENKLLHEGVSEYMTHHEKIASKKI
jgi:lysophospholipid acyltransferase (LPLAT)-like uncharacterized protein